MGRTKSRTKKALWRLWGYLVLAAVIYVWTRNDTDLMVILILSGLSFFYMLFAAPMWCMAPNSTNGKPCSNNAHGLLIGCWIRKHKWEKLKMVFRRQRWTDLCRRSWSTIGAQAATIGAVGSFASAVAAIITLIVKK
jgi:transposase